MKGEGVKEEGEESERKVELGCLSYCDLIGRLVAFLFLLCC